MTKRQKNAEPPAASAATVGYEAQLWQMADALRGSMDAAEYKHVVLGLIFLKYISDAFEEQHAKLVADQKGGADPEDPDEYRALSIFWVPPEARWQHLKSQARQSTIGQLVDDAMAGIERDNPALKGVLPKDYARPALDKTRLGQLIDDRLSADLRDAFPDMSGLSPRNLRYIRDFASAWPEPEIVQRLLPNLTWGQNVVLLDKERDQQARLWYASQCAERGWSRSVLALQIEHLN